MNLKKCLIYIQIFFFFTIDSQINEVAKMLYQQGLTELIPSSPSEQVAYLLVERASLLEATETPERLARDGADAAVEEMKAQVLEPAAPQVSGTAAPEIQNKQKSKQTHK